MKSSSLLSLLLATLTSSALSYVVVPQSKLTTTTTTTTNQNFQHKPITRKPTKTTCIFSTPSDESSDDATTSPDETVSAAPVMEVKSTPEVSEDEGTSYPIDVPSPVLLSASMILAIVGTGSAFDLGGGSPSLGFATTAAIAAVTIPLCLFLFYASILKATAETEADDEEYMRGK